MENIAKNKLIILTGPTAVGKTDLSINLAKRINGEIISADSIQVYRRMDIGSAKITSEEMQGVPHHLIDILNPDEEFNVAMFSELAKKAISDIAARGRIPIVVGGTGFYINALLYDNEFTETEDDGYRKELEQLVADRGIDYIYAMLIKEDPASAKAIHKNNVKRVIRALEYKHQTGELMSEHNKCAKQKESPYNFAYFVLNNDRAILYDRIDKRIDIMVKDGLIEEVKGLIEDYNIDPSMTSMQGLGYKEIYDYLKGTTTLDEAIYILKRDTRHFAKRQLTWFKGRNDVNWVDKSILETEDKQLDFMLNILREKGIIDNE